MGDLKHGDPHGQHYKLGRQKYYDVGSLKSSQDVKPAFISWPS